MATRQSASPGGVVIGNDDAYDLLGMLIQLFRLLRGLQRVSRMRVIAALNEDMGKKPLRTDEIIVITRMKQGEH